MSKHEARSQTEVGAQLTNMKLQPFEFRRKSSKRVAGSGETIRGKVLRTRAGGNSLYDTPPAIEAQKLPQLVTKLSTSLKLMPIFILQHMPHHFLSQNKTHKCK